MSGLRRIIRHPDRRVDPHARAMSLASERMTDPLAPGDAAWLDDHLLACSLCRERADAFAADAALLAGLRASPPPPPRDLAARLEAALDRELPPATAPERRSIRFARARRQPSLALVGVWTVAVVAIVGLPLVLSLGGGPRSSAPVAAATPIAVPPQTVAWVSRNADGHLVLSTATVDQVCPATAATTCLTLDGTAQAQLPMTAAQAVLLDPSGGAAAVVVGDNGVYAMAVPAVTRASSRPSTEPSSVAPSPTPSATGVLTSPPVGTPVPTGSAAPSPSVSPSSSPSSPASSASVEPSPSTGASPSPAATPSPSPASPAASPSASPGATAAPASSSPAASGSLAPGTPAPSAATSYAIAQGVVLVGAPAAYSSDGQWVAFSARPQDGHQGPDLYVWKVGTATASVITSNHATVFSGWLGGQILASVPVVGATAASPSAGPSAGASAASSGVEPPGSVVDGSPAPSVVASPEGAVPGSTADAAAADRTPGSSVTPAPSGGSALDQVTPAPPSADPATVTGRSFLVDPQSGAAQPIGPDGMWRPVVDATGRTVVYWTGRFSWSDDQAAWVPAGGALMAGTWRSADDRSAVVGAVPLPNPAGDGTVVAWDARFDPTSHHLAVWTSDVVAAAAGSLTLVDINADGTLGKTRFQTDSALPNYSLDADRLAWATPPDATGRGSVVEIYAWTANGGGRLDSKPDSGTAGVVVAH